MVSATRTIDRWEVNKSNKSGGVAPKVNPFHQRACNPQNLWVTKGTRDEGEDDEAEGGDGEGSGSGEKKEEKKEKEGDGEDDKKPALVDKIKQEVEAMDISMNEAKAPKAAMKTAHDFDIDQLTY